MRWFRRRAQGGQAAQPAESAAPHASPTDVAAPPAPQAAQTDTKTESDTDPAKPKRRRGSRGGRGRSKKTGAAAAAEATAEAKPAAEKKRPEKKTAKADKPERKPSQRQARAATRRRVPQRRPPLPPAKRELLVSVDVGERRVAVLEDDRVAEVYLERPDRRSIAGDIYLGTVDNVLPGMEAAFVEIGLEKNGFLYVDEIVTPELEGKRHGKRIQDLISRGQTIMVQAVKDPMKTKGARLTTEISLPGRFVVFVPQGEGLGVSRRLEDDERQRLKDILKKLNVKEGGVIVRTAAEGASEEDIERDLVFLQRLWKTIQARAKEVKAPALVYQEAELPLRVTRDLFAGDFERALVDDDRTYKRIVGYLKKTSPHMAERVVRYKEKTPLFEASGVDAEIRSTLSRRVDLPSGGYLVFDYAEAFTVIDVNTGRFVGSRSKSSGARLEDTITKNNLEAVKEVVRQLRLRDIGGIIVIDFIDMANPKNRAAVEEALRSELERDRTKTYVVEISPLGLVEMTRQNVTDGPREILTKKCPTCGGDGIVVSETTAAMDIERKLRDLAAGSRTQAYRVRLHPRVASLLVGPGAARLVEIEERTKRRFYIEADPSVDHLDHFEVVKQGPRSELAPKVPVEEGAELQLKLVEVGLHDSSSGVGKVDGYDVCVADAAKLVGKKVKVRVERALDGTAYAALVDGPKGAAAPITAEAEAEKPTRKPPARKGAAAATAEGETEVEAVAEEPEPETEAEAEAVADAPAAEGDETPAPPKKRTRRGSRGGRGRKKTGAAAAATTVESDGDAQAAEEESVPTPEPVDGVPAKAVIHLPGPDLGQAGDGGDEDGVPQGDGAVAADEAPKPKKRSRRGSRGGRNRKKKTATAAGANGASADGAEADGAEASAVADAPEAALETPVAESDGAAADGGGDEDWGYVPMSEWADELEPPRTPRK